MVSSQLTAQDRKSGDSRGCLPSRRKKDLNFMKRNKRAHRGMVPFVLSVLCLLSFNTLAHAEAAFPKLAAKVEAKQPVTVVCFGDSVTGVYYHTGGRRAYTAMVEIGLQQAYPETDITAINAGISGHTTVNALARIDNDVLAKKPDLVTVMFGLNDMTRVPLEDYRANLKTIIAKCREIGAEVLLCTPNSVTTTEGRPTEKLEEYVAVVREVAEAEATPLADCYADFVTLWQRDRFEWAMEMSDEIHPNMAGHKHIAEVIVEAVTGMPPNLSDVPALQPVLTHTAARIAAKEPLNIIAMPPYDTIISKLLAEVAPESPVTMVPWIVEGQTVAEIEIASKGIRDKKYDLVFIAVPASATSENPEAFLHEFGWILSYSLSFGLQEWDVVAVPPSLAVPLEGEGKTRDEWQKRLIRAQDFPFIDGDGGDIAAAETTLRAWLTKQVAMGVK